MNTHPQTCPLCEAMCGLVVETEGARVRSIRGDFEDSFSRGHICPKAVALQDLHQDPDRQRHPLRRTATGWERISWEDAFDETAARLKEVQAAHGRDSVAVYQGNPSVHNLGVLLFAPEFVRSLKTKNRYSATSVDQLPHHFMAYHVLGHQLLVPIPDLDRTDYLLMLGGNPAVSNGSLMSAPDIRKRIQAVSQRGGEVVLFDPRRSETAKLSDQHHFIRPGTDALLLAAMLRTLFESRMVAPGRVGAFTDGIEQLRDAVQPFSPERVAPHTGVAAADIRAVALDFARAPTAVCHARMGASTQGFGGLCQWLATALNLVTGNLDSPGGAMFTTPAVDLLAGLSGRAPRGSFGRWRSRVRGLPEFGGELPVSALTEEMTTPGPGQVRSLVTIAGNPVLSTPGGQHLDRALSELDFMVSVDFYITETTRHAHILLPPVGPLERPHYDLVFHLLAIRNTARFSEPVFQAPPDSKQDWEIFRELERRTGGGDVKSMARRKLYSSLGPEGLLDGALRVGPYGSGANPLGDGLTLKKLRANPHGVDLGPLQPRLPERLFTDSGRVELGAEVFLKDMGRLEQRLEQAAPDLVLIGLRHLRSNNSWLHNSERLVRGKPRCVLVMNPEDARSRGIEEGQSVAVRSRVGELQVPVRLSDEMMPGVVALPHGWGHGLDGVQLRVASQRPGVNVNALTDPSVIDELTGNAVLNGVPVQVSAGV